MFARCPPERRVAHHEPFQPPDRSPRRPLGHRAGWLRALGRRMREGRDLGVGMSRRRLLRDLACAALVLAAGAVLWLGIGLAYALAAEYGSAASGDSVGSGLRNAVLGGLLIGLLTWALVWPAIHLIARRPLAGRHPAVTLGVIVLVAIVGV